MSERAVFIVNGTVPLGRHVLTRIDRVTEATNATTPPYALTFKREDAEHIVRLLMADAAVTDMRIKIEPGTRWQLVRDGTKAGPARRVVVEVISADEREVWYRHTNTDFCVGAGPEGCRHRESPATFRYAFESIDGATP